MVKPAPRPSCRWRCILPVRCWSRFFNIREGNVIGPRSYEGVFVPGFGWQLFQNVWRHGEIPELRQYRLNPSLRQSAVAIAEIQRRPALAPAFQMPVGEGKP